jgi:hypothetical protein
LREASSLLTLAVHSFCRARSTQGLKLLSEDDFKELGIKAMGPRKKIMNALK